MQQIFPRQDFKQDSAQAEDVRSAVDVGFAERDFRRHVERGAVAAAGRGQSGIGLFAGLHAVLQFVVRIVQDLRESPVQHERLAESSDDDVRGFQVPMDDALIVGIGDAISHLDQDIKQPGEGILLDRLRISDLDGLEDVPQVAAFHAFHREVEIALAVPAQFVHGDGAGMLDVGGDPGLAQEARRLDVVV